MEIQGNLHKMKSILNNPIEYSLLFEEQEIRLNEYIGRRMTLKYQHEINCVRCGRKTNKSFAQGYCYPCFSTSPETEECVLRPELCQAHEGIARDIEYAESHCLIDHFVYLSNTSGLKVGVTRSTQIPTRWIDQGAVSAIKIACTPNRYLAGCIEVALKAHLADKTNWRTMLKQEEPQVDLKAESQRVITLLPVTLQAYALPNENPVLLNYPVQQKLTKVTSLSLDKTDVISDSLVGIKGQYLLFASEKVFNVRKHGGYKIRITFS